MAYIGRRTLSVGQEHELLAALKRAGLNEDDAQAVILSPGNGLAQKVLAFIRGGGLETGVTEDERRAIAILGKDKVVTRGEVAQGWGVEPPEAPCPPFSDDDLRQCAQENKAGTADWRLVFILGLSLREQRELRGTDQDRQPCFDSNKWWLNESEDSWAAKRVKAGHHLLNLQLRFTDRNWQEQEEDIARLGEDCERAQETAVAEAVLSIFMTSRERLFDTTYHWGNGIDSSGARVLVGRFNSDGFFVGYDRLGDSSSAIGVVVARKL